MMDTPYGPDPLDGRYIAGEGTIIPLWSLQPLDIAWPWAVQSANMWGMACGAPAPFTTWQSSRSDWSSWDVYCCAMDGHWQLAVALVQGRAYLPEEGG
jgi:hypothetical protein